MRHCIPVWNGASVEGSVVSAGSPAAVLCGQYVEGGRTWFLGATGCAVLQHGVEFSLGHGHAVRCKAAWAAGYWRTWRLADMVRCVVPHLTLDAGRFCEPREFLHEAVCGRKSYDDLHIGDGLWSCEAWRGS